ncbi:MAG: regulatory protein RecX [Marinobacter sp.]
MAKSLKKKDPDQQAPEAALRLLARREHSRLELSLKLRQRGTSPQVIEQVLDDFEERGWLSDARFAEVFVRQRLASGYGPLKIQADLRQRGVGSDPPELLAVAEDQWIERAVVLREKRFGLTDISQDWAERQRQGGFLARRGFSTEQVEQALEVVRASEV